MPCRCFLSHSEDMNRSRTLVTVEGRAKAKPVARVRFHERGLSLLLAEVASLRPPSPSRPPPLTVTRFVLLVYLPPSPLFHLFQPEQAS